MNYREADQREYIAVRTAPFSTEFVVENVQVSRQALVLYDSTAGPIMVGGVLPVGIIWAVGTDAIKDSIKEVSAECRGILRAWADISPDHVLQGMIDSRNTKHIQWLERMGFRVFPPMLNVMFSGIPFLYFRKEYNNV